MFDFGAGYGIFEAINLNVICSLVVMLDELSKFDITHINAMVGIRLRRTKDFSRSRNDGEEIESNGIFGE